MHVMPCQPDSGVCLSVLIGLNRAISAHQNEFMQNRWFFAILSNTGASKYFARKYGDFLKLTLLKDKYQRKKKKMLELVKELHLRASDVRFDPKQKCTYPYLHSYESERCLCVSSCNMHF
jgi:hypothetical protein